MDVFPITVDEDVYEIPVNIVDDLPPMWGLNSPGVTPATCTLKTPVCCPRCSEWIRSVHVEGVGRPEPGNGTGSRYLVVVCPECDEVIPHELAGL